MASVRNGVAVVATLLVASAAVALAASGGKTPEQIHLAFGHSHSEFTVSWATQEQAGSDVQYGVTSTLGSQVSGQTAAPYTVMMIPKDTYNGFQNYTSEYMHHVTITGLEPNTTYYYSCGDLTDGTMSGTFSFVTLPLEGSPAPITFSVVGDLGQTTDSVQTVNHMMEEVDTVAILHAGDMSYADCDGSRWSSYLNLVQPLAVKKAWQVVMGNHEIEPDNNTGHLATALKRRYRMPEVKPGVDTSQQYQSPTDHGYDCTPSALTGSYDFGNSFYVVTMGQARVYFLNSYTETTQGSAQYEWLEEELRAINRTMTPWVIAVYHSPWFNSNPAHQAEFNTIAMREAMEPLFYKYGVDIAISGHVHAYERSHPVYNNVTRPEGKATVYLNIGDGGNREGEASFGSSAQPAWSAFRDGTVFGHGRLLIVNRSTAIWEWHRNDKAEWTVSDKTKIERFTGNDSD